MKPHLIDPIAGITHECYALINKPYILDLAPGASLVEYLVGRK